MKSSVKTRLRGGRGGTPSLVDLGMGLSSLNQRPINGQSEIGLYRNLKQINGKGTQ
jgi:hypothetical protein